MKTWQRLLAVVALVLLFASACSDDDPAPVASTPDVTAAPETDAVEPDPEETTGEPDQPAARTPRKRMRLNPTSPHPLRKRMRLNPTQAPSKRTLRRPSHKKSPR